MLLPWTELIITLFLHKELLLCVPTIDGTQLLCVLPWTEHLLAHFLLHGVIALCSTINGTSSRTFSITQSNCSVFYHERNIFSHVFYYTEQLLCVLPWTEHLLTHFLLHGAIALCSTMNVTSSHTLSITRAITLCSTIYGTSNHIISTQGTSTMCSYHRRNFCSHVFYYTEQLLGA